MLRSDVMHEFFQNEIGMAPASPIKLICGRDLSVVDCLGIMSLFVGQEGAKIASMEAGASTERPRVTARFAT